MTNGASWREMRMEEFFDFEALQMGTPFTKNLGADQPQTIC